MESKNDEEACLINGTNTGSRVDVVMGLDEWSHDRYEGIEFHGRVRSGR